MLLPFNKIWSSFVIRLPSGVFSTSVTSSSSMLTKSSNPSNVPVISLSFFIRMWIREPIHLSTNSKNEMQNVNKVKTIGEKVVNFDVSSRGSKIFELTQWKQGRLISWSGWLSHVWCINWVFFQLFSGKVAVKISVLKRVCNFKNDSQSFDSRGWPRRRFLKCPKKCPSYLSRSQIWPEFTRNFLEFLGIFYCYLKTT